MPIMSTTDNSRCPYPDEQIIPQSTKSISTPETSCNAGVARCIRKRRTGPITYVTRTRTFCANIFVLDCEEKSSCISEKYVAIKQDNEGEGINRSRWYTKKTKYYNNEVDDSSKSDSDNEGADDGNNDNDNDDNKSAAFKQHWRRISIWDNERQRQRDLVAGHREKQRPKKVAIINKFIGSFILFIGTMGATTACPEIIASICRCDDSHNGIILKCSHTDGPQAVRLLRANQINLGLIQQLEMQNSGLKNIPAGFFSGLFIKKLDLSYNHIADVDENGFLGMNNVLQELVLHHNNLTRLPAKALIPLSALLRLDLSNNSIGNIEAEHALPPLSKLYDINLADNRICQVHKNAFDDVRYSIQAINLGRNCLKEVPAPAIRGFKQLMALHLHNNNISTLEALSFMNLPLMNLLNLASNQISTIHKQTFLNVPNLRYLYLTGNRVTDIRPYQFNSFEQLEMIDLTGNYLIELQEDSFSNLQNLRQLYLGQNRIVNIQPRTFSNSSIVILILNANRLVELQEGMFDGLAKLQQLAIKDNQIRSIDQNSFYSNPSLAMIDLSNNELMDIPPSTFLAQINLFLIDLSGNKLLRTPYGAFNRRVRTVLLQENPLVCSERVHMLQQGIGIYVASSEDAVCGPKKNSDQSRIGNVTNDNIDNISSTSSTYFTVEQQTEFKQKEELSAASKAPSIIRPMSTIDNEADKPKQDDISNARLMPVRPVNAPKNVQPAISSPQAPDIGKLPGILETKPDSEIRDSGNIGRYDNDRGVAEDIELHNKTGSDDAHRYPFDTNNMIHPFPVPFLKRPSKLSQAYIAVPGDTQATDVAATDNTVSSEQTLPPSIVVADHIHGQESEHSDTVAPETEANYIERVSMGNAKEIQETGEQILFDLDNTERLERVAAPSVIILICLSTVAIVMAAVFIGLCVAKHRRMQTIRGSMTTDSAAAARTNAYVAAQLDMIYGTVQRNRCRNISMPNRFEDGQPWIYAPTSYGSAGYYK